MFGLNRARPATDLDHQPEPSPLTVRMRHIDIELTKLAGQPRTENVRKALDHWLDRRLQLRSGEGGAAGAAVGRLGGDGGEAAAREAGYQA